MKRRSWAYRSWAGRMALGLAIAAIAVPSAVAIDTDSLGDAQWGPANVVAVPSVTIPEGWEARQFGPAALPAPTPVTPVPVSDLLANPQLGPANVIDVPTVPVTVVGKDGFDFVDAVIGGAIALAVALLAAAAVLVTRRRGQLVGA